MDRSASASIPSSTAGAPLYSFPIPSFSLQGKNFSSLSTALVIIVSLLVLEQAVYRYKKKHLPGAKWTIPLIGKFADSMSPSLEGYIKQWNSGDLSAVSVFNMYVCTIDTSSYTNAYLASLSWLRQMTTLVRSSTHPHMLSRVSCIP